MFYVQFESELGDEIGLKVSGESFGKRLKIDDLCATGKSVQATMIMNVMMIFIFEKFHAIII